MATDPAQTSWTVLRAAAEGESRALSDFERLYGATVRGYLEARWRAPQLRGEISDAVQEVFVECLKSGGVLDRADEIQGDFRGLLFGVTRNVARRFERDALAADRIRPEEATWFEQVPGRDPGLSTAFDRNWARSLVQQGVELHKQRAQAEGPAGRRRIELLERRFGKDEPIRDIAASWGIPLQDAHNAYRKARQEFHACLREIVALHCSDGTAVDAECRRVLADMG